MKIRYRKKHVNRNLIIAVIWLAYGIFQIAIAEKFHWLYLGWFALSAVYFFIYYNHKINHYLTIEKGVIKQNWPFGKRMNLSDIIQIKHFAGDYILKSEKEKMTIHIQAIDEDSIINLKSLFEKLTAEWN